MARGLAEADEATQSFQVSPKGICRLIKQVIDTFIFVVVKLPRSIERCSTIFRLRLKNAQY
ncbi:hypothetical protein AOQ73_39995 [Bradyrhizobium pachyrhizi]|nr:hypothetical protein AOQ73_39995 [Bradyrhizobium pachyrhizi]